eukprot:3020709-Rhodomonas_salina.2
MLGRWQHDRFWDQLGRQPGLTEGGGGRFGFFSEISCVPGTPLTGRTVTMVCSKVAEEMRKEPGDPLEVAEEARRVSQMGEVSLAVMLAASTIMQWPLSIHIPGRDVLTIWGRRVPQNAPAIGLAWWNRGNHCRPNTWRLLLSTAHVGARLDRVYLDEEDAAVLQQMRRPPPELKWWTWATRMMPLPTTLLPDLLDQHPETAAVCSQEGFPMLLDERVAYTSADRAARGIRFREVNDGPTVSRP